MTAEVTFGRANQRTEKKIKDETPEEAKDPQDHGEGRGGGTMRSKVPQPVQPQVDKFLFIFTRREKGKNSKKLSKPKPPGTSGVMRGRTAT